MNQTFEGQLEIDRDRGVIYFHALIPQAGVKIPTLLRICQLPKDLPEFGEQLVDVTALRGMVSGKNYARRFQSPLDS